MDFTPSAFTPFLRRFTDERARDLEDTKRLYERVGQLHRASRYAREEASSTVGTDIYLQYYRIVPEPVQPAFMKCQGEILELERCIFEFPEIDLNKTQLTLKEATDLRCFLRAKEYFHSNEDKVFPLLRNCLIDAFAGLADPLPSSYNPSPFTIPLIYAVPDAKDQLDRVIAHFSRPTYTDVGLFIELSRTLYLNMCSASGILDPSEPKKPFKWPSKCDEPLQEIVDTYFAGTPFRDFFLAPMPLKFTHQERFSHMHVLGGSGAGKTTLLQNLILHDLHSEDPPSLVIVDSQGDLISKISRLALFDPENGKLAKRLVIIDPKDIQHPPAINIFDVNRERLAKYDEAAKEQVVAGVIQTFDYLFAGLLGADLTAKQGVFFRYVARLMLTLPETMGRNATILDMLNLMDDPVPYKEAIASLPPIQRNFFERDFASKTFAQTREQIRYRLNAILENPTLARLFTATETKIDIFDTLNNGGIILIDTAKDFLKGASGHFGRIFISLVLQAVLERAAIPEQERKAVFVVVDEAAAYFDGNIDDFLTETRKYKCGCVFAHQFLDQASSSLKASLAANTSIKIMGGISMGDARALAPDLRTTPDFILSQPKLHFAAYIRNVTPQAVSIPVPLGALESQPRLSEGQYKNLQEQNRIRICSAKSLPRENLATKGNPEARDTAGEAASVAVTNPSPDW